MICIVVSQDVLHWRNDCKSVQHCLRGSLTEIAKAVGILSEWVHHILTDELEMKILSSL